MSTSSAITTATRILRSKRWIQFLVPILNHCFGLAVFCSIYRYLQPSKSGRRLFGHPEFVVLQFGKKRSTMLHMFWAEELWLDENGVCDLAESWLPGGHHGRIIVRRRQRRDKSLTRLGCGYAVRLSFSILLARAYDVTTSCTSISFSSSSTWLLETVASSPAADFEGVVIFFRGLAWFARLFFGFTAHIRLCGSRDLCRASHYNVWFSRGNFRCMVTILDKLWRWWHLYNKLIVFMFLSMSDILCFIRVNLNHCLFESQQHLWISLSNAPLAKI